jgi:transcription initiation factor TFIID subunit 11
MLDPERGVSTLCPFEPESVARNHLSSLNHRGRILANASLGARVLTTRSLTLVPPLVRRQDPSQEAPLAKKPRPADSAGDKDDDDDDDVVVEKRGAPSSGAGGDAKDGDDDDEGEREIADGDDFERRRKRGGASGATNKNKNTNLENGDDEEDEMANDEARGADREKMAEMLRYFTPEQMDRYECYRRSSLPKTALRRVFQAVTGTILNPNGLIVLAAVGKLFVGELVELAREIADDEGVSDLDEIKPAHVREAHRRMEQSGNLFRAKKKPLFRKRGA